MSGLVANNRQVSRKRRNKGFGGVSYFLSLAYVKSRECRSDNLKRCTNTDLKWRNYFLFLFHIDLQVISAPKLAQPQSLGLQA